MPLFEISGDDLVPFRRVTADEGLYESEIEDLLWDNIDAFVGEPLFLVCRQKAVQGRGIPDVIAIDMDGNVFVIEVKRDIDRAQLAQCLEYAGWARNAGIEDLAKLYADGPESFFLRWNEFTGSASPKLITDSPRLLLVARDIDDRTSDALDFLTDSNLPVEVLRVTVYHDETGRRFVAVDSEHEPDFATVADEPNRGPVHLKFDGRKVQIADLLDAGLLTAGQELTWYRPRSDTRYSVTVTGEGKLKLPDGQETVYPSKAAGKVVGSGSFDGWEAWRTEDGALLHELRSRLVEASSKSDELSD